MLNITAYVGTSPPAAERGWFYDYQTLVTGVLALLAALIAAEIARRQLKETRRQADRDRAGRLRAARASLPTVLSTICDYAETTGRSLYGAWPAAARLYPDDVNAGDDYQIKVTIEPFPASVLGALERVVELTETEEVADRIESILREAQVLGARLRKLGAGDSLTTDHLAVYILQAASIYARAESLFGYARRQHDGVSDGSLWNRVFAALSFFGVEDEEVLGIARRERDGGLSPGEADTLPVAC